MKYQNANTGGRRPVRPLPEVKKADLIVLAAANTLVTMGLKNAANGGRRS